jgi:hypothetical protein
VVPGKLSDRLWGPLFARGYDRFVSSSEDAGLRDKRRDLLARARGRTIEIGAGTGINIELYPDAVTELVLTEPDPHMRTQQDRLEQPWGWFGRGCHPNRDTLAAISASALEVSEVEQGDFPKAPPIVRPLIVGAAKPPAS